MSDEITIFNNATDFIDFLNNNQAVNEDLEKTFTAVLANMRMMEKTLSNRPCGCGGVNPDLVIQQRRDNLESFYRTWVLSLEGEEVERLKSSLKNVSFRSGEEVLLELL